MGLTIYLGYELYERSGDFDWLGGDGEGSGTKASASASFPDEIEIVRRDGSRLDVRLTARNGTHIQFVRLSDGADFTYEIGQLDAATEKLVMRYPDTGLSNADEFMRSGVIGLEAAHVEQLRERIARIDAELNDLQSRLSASRSKTESLTLRREAEKLQAERQKLESDIAERTGG